MTNQPDVPQTPPPNQATTQHPYQPAPVQAHYQAPPQQGQYQAPVQQGQYQAPVQHGQYQAPPQVYQSGVPQMYTQQPQGGGYKDDFSGQMTTQPPVYVGSPIVVQQQPPPAKIDDSNPAAYFFFGFIIAFLLDLFAFLFFACAEGAGIVGKRKTPFLIGVIAGCILNIVGIIVIFYIVVRN